MNPRSFGPGRPEPPGRSQRVLVLLGTLLLVVLGLWASWWAGRFAEGAGHSHQPGRTTLHRVSGGSMMPTLVGDHGTADCGRCGLQWLIEPQDSAGPSDLICFHCGEPASLASRHLRGQAASVRSFDPARLRRGDIVVIRWDDQLHVKRVVALGGDVVDVDAMLLSVNEQRVEDLLVECNRESNLPRFLVDADARREQSRWAPVDDPSSWVRTPQRRWKHCVDESSPWLVYHHLDVRHGGRASRVWDDYPFNVTLSRKLFSVDRFIVQGRIVADAPVAIEIAYWSPAGTRVMVVHPDRDGTFQSHSRDASHAPITVVDETRPVAIRLRGEAILADLSIHRLVEYRLRPGDDRKRYPINIDDGDCFVLGDNVQVSVDSRDIGPVPVADIVGRIESQP